MHERADDPFFFEKREGVIIARSMPLASYRLGLNGVCDVVEFHPSTDGVNLPGREGTFIPTLVEYKHGDRKEDGCDEVQLCAQAMCLEEMLSVSIQLGYLYYGKIRRRVEVSLNDELRGLVGRIATEMHQYYERGYTPKVKPSKACRSCSLEDVCMPELQGKVMAASKYIQMRLDEE